MSTLKDAVVEAARKFVARHPARPFDRSTTSNEHYALCRAVRALDAAQEPDVDALNAAVAEECDKWERGHGSLSTMALCDAVRAKREALKPRLRYEAHNHEVRRDGEWYLCAPTEARAKEVAALLNAQEPKP